MKFDSSAPAIVLSPHHDDAALGCWHLLADPGRALSVATVFAGIPPTGVQSRYHQGNWIGSGSSSASSADWTSAGMMRQRRREDREALGSLGKPLYHLPLLDEGYVSRDATYNLFAASLGEHQGECSRLYAPLATSRAGHRPNADHRLVREWVRQLAGAEIPVSYYADLPYSFRSGSVDWVSELEVADVRRVELTDQQVERKLNTLRKYETQWQALVAVWRDREDIALDDPSVWRYEALADPAPDNT
jgi:hypothetical protein